MAEMGKGVTAGKLASNVQKKLTRAQEKVLQKLGKADETRDTAFEEGVTNFNKQMLEGSKLQKDLKAYLVAVKTMHEASRRLQDCLADMYEPDWFGKEEVDAMAEEMIEKEMDNNLEDTDSLWTDYYQKLVDQSLISMDTYLAQFPDVKARIAKRDRKLVDYDSARHHFASLQKGKKKDDVKMAKPMSVLEKAAPGWAQGMLSAHHVAQTNLSRSQAEEELARSQKVFDEINVDLQEELPALWNSRVGFYVNTFQGMAGYQEKFHKEMAKLNVNLNDIMTKLDEQRLVNEGANHNATSDSPIKPPQLRPGPPSRPPPRVTPTQDLKQENIINLFEEAMVPDAIPDTTPQAPSLESWEGEQPPATEEPHDYVQEAGLEEEATPAAPPFTQPGWDSEPGWDADEPAAPQSYTQPSWDEAEGGQGAQTGWGEDGPQAVQSEGGWGDDGGAQVGLGEEDGATGWAVEGQTGWANSEGQPQWEKIADGEGELASTDSAEAAADTAGSPVTNGSDGVDMPDGFTFKVKAMHDYAATDGDELDMKAGDVVLVIAFDNPDEQDDGWLMGVKEDHWLQHKNMSIKGVFPENFTQRL
ncbi:myc box-dependent-interacting protein 1b isoform X2 [Osmerus eperlanus]|uniref:myc box-dependent-interacting protein 1b isoform X2 n=1 Tax=Osmerus eperlanus TaxID=29151 RepID=UPI002E168213